jgi:DNA-binding NarL/FixJ family response regulator
MIRTLIVEESGVARLGIQAMLGEYADILEIDVAGSCAEVAEKLDARYYELIILEPKMSGAAGTTLIGQMRGSSPWSALLIFTALDELTFGVQAIRDGARGYLMKTATCDEFRTALKRVSRGQVYLSKALAAEFAVGLRKYDMRAKPHETFSKREFQVFSMAVCGLTPAECAHVLQLTPETIGRLRRGAMDKLGAGSLHEMVEYARAQRLLDECRAACSALWNRRFDQDCRDGHYADRPAARISTFAVQAASSAGIKGLAMR